MTAHTCRTLDPNCWRCNLNLDEIGFDGASVPPSSAVQGSVRTEGPTGAVEGECVEISREPFSDAARAALVAATSHVSAKDVWLPPEHEPPVVARLRTLATAELEAAKGGTRIQKAAAKAAARAYRLAADMIEEEQ